MFAWKMAIAFVAPSLLLANDVAHCASTLDTTAPRSQLNEPKVQTRYRLGVRLALGAVTLSLWPCAAGCGATTRTDDGASAHAGASNVAGSSGTAGASGSWGGSSSGQSA